MDPPPRLACRRCKSRKIKCDKSAPCSACRSAGLSCHTVQRVRLPRGKTAKARNHNQALEARVARIESLLDQQAEVPRKRNPTPNTCFVDISASGSKDVVDRKIDDFVAPAFWNALSEEIHGLREALEAEDSEGEEEIREAEPWTEQTRKTSSTKAILFHGSYDGTDHTPPCPPLNIRTTLLDLYRYRVDSVYKILHWPTVLSIIEANHARSTQHPPLLAARVLEYAIYFMALCTITDEEADTIGSGVRLETRRQYQTTVEDLLVESDLLQHPDLVILQAFVIYLVGLRTCLSGAYTWTLVAVAVRAAEALRLGDDNPVGFSPFDLELRRRLFYAIGILDTHSALDRGTMPILPSQAFLKPPLNVNDADISPFHNLPIISCSGPTNTSHTAMIYEAMICQRRLYELSCGAQDGWEQWAKKLELLSKFEESVMKSHVNMSDLAGPLETLQKTSAKKILVSMQLLARRPPYRQANNTVPPWDDFDVMETATEVLEQHLQIAPPELQPWAWKNWVQWHALAVLLAELTVRPQDPSSDKAYLVAIQSFHHYAQLVADSESGLLWKPVVKLMRRVRRIREGTQQARFPTTSNSTMEVPDNNVSHSEQPSFGLFDEHGTFDSANLGSEINFSTSLYRNNDSQFIEQCSGTELGNDTPWLAWDTFIRDFHDSSV